MDDRDHAAGSRTTREEDGSLIAIFPSLPPSSGPPGATADAVAAWQPELPAASWGCCPPAAGGAERREEKMAEIIPIKFNRKLDALASFPNIDAGMVTAVGKILERLDDWEL